MSSSSLASSDDTEAYRICFCLFCVTQGAIMPLADHIAIALEHPLGLVEVLTALFMQHV